MPKKSLLNCSLAGFCILNITQAKAAIMGAKIRTAEIDKIPIMIIIGENEVNDKVISVRRKFKGDLGKLDLENFIENIKLEISSRNL